MTPFALTEEHLRGVLLQDGFNPQEIEGIIRSGKGQAAQAVGKQLEIITVGAKPALSGANILALTPTDYARLLPFLMLAGAEIDHKRLLLEALRLAAIDGWEMTTPFARWAQFLPDDIKTDAEVRSLVVALVDSQPVTVGLVADKLIRAMHLKPHDLVGAFKENALNPLVAVSFPARATLPAGFLESAIQGWYVPGEVWPDLAGTNHAVRLVQHTDKMCGGCAWMTQWHTLTLSEPSSAEFGNTALIRLSGQIVGAIKGVKAPSFIALRNIGGRPGDPDFVWAGGVYETGSELVERALAALKTGKRFPIIDVSHLTLKPIDFLTENGAEKDWLLNVQRALSRRIP